MVASQVIQYLQNLISRRVDARDCAVITVGTFNAGTAENIVADKAVLTGTIRTDSKELKEFLINEIKAKLPEFVKSYNAQINIEFKDSYIPVINNDEKTKFLEKNIIDLLGQENCINISQVRMDVEDVAYFLNEIPGSFFRLGVRNEKIDAIYDLHHPKFKVDEEAIKIGMMVQFKNALEFLK